MAPLKRVITKEACSTLSAIPPLCETKVTDTDSGMRMDACVFVRVSVLQGRGELACALLEKLDCSVQKQRSFFVYKHNRRWLPIQPSSNRPLNKRLTHPFLHTHTHKLSSCLSVCLPLTHTHQQTNREPSSQRTVSRRSSRETLWTPTVKTVEEQSRAEKGNLSLRGGKLSPLLQTWLTLRGH